MVTTIVLDISGYLPPGALRGCPDTPDVPGKNQHNIDKCGSGSLGVISDGCVPEHSCLCRIRGRTDFFGSAAFPPAWEDWCIVLLTLTALLAPVLVPVWGRPLKRSL